MLLVLETDCPWERWEGLSGEVLSCVYQGRYPWGGGACGRWGGRFSGEDGYLGWYLRMCCLRPFLLVVCFPHSLQ